MEFLVDFEINVPERTPEAEVKDRQKAEAVAAAKLADEGHIVRVWERSLPTGETGVLSLYCAGSETELEGLLRGLPLHEWMKVTITALKPHPNDPGGCAGDEGSGGCEPVMSDQLPEPRLTLVYRLEATLGEPLDLGESAQGHHRIIPQTGGRFRGPEIAGKLLPGASADWQIVLPDGTALADLRYTLQTDDGALLYVRSRGVRHGSPEVLARLARGEDVNAGEYTFRTTAQIETAAPELDWLNKGVFVGVGGRRPAGVIYETYLVG
jgi:muconolactone delta-isomerase